jgi:hypothetical protein
VTVPGLHRELRESPELQGVQDGPELSLGKKGMSSR